MKQESANWPCLTPFAAFYYKSNRFFLLPMKITLLKSGFRDCIRDAFRKLFGIRALSFALDAPQDAPRQSPMCACSKPLRNPPEANRGIRVKNYRASPQTNARGFSLVLALVVTSMLLLLVITLVAFISVDLVITASTAERQRARFNALASLRVAVAHLQQEVGADQRVTAQANVTLPVTSGEPDAIRAKWNNLNPYWTGVWDTRPADKSADPRSEQYYTRPPAWLVSGKVQLQSLAGKTEYENTAYQHPWKHRDQLLENKADIITLFSNLSTTAAENNPVPFDTRVTVARVPLQSGPAGVSAGANTIGHFAYWVGDEGVKARLNKIDQYAKENASSHKGIARLYAGGRAATELFPLWENIKVNQPNREHGPGLVQDTEGFANIPQLNALTSGVAGIGVAATYAHAVTAYSQGVLADTRSGGLKQDLSLLFELGEENFDATPFGMNGNGPATFQSNALGAPGISANPRWEAVKLNIFSGEKYALEGGIKRGIAGGGWMRPIARPLFNVKGVNGGNLFGPAWAVLRDFYRLYKPGNYIGNTFVARTYEPNAVSIGPFIAGFGDTTPIFSHVVTNDMMRGKDPNTTDNWRDGAATPRPMTVAATPQAVRCTLLFGAQQNNGALRLVVNPIIVVHNPYNIPVKYRTSATPDTANKPTAGMRLSLRYQCVSFSINITKQNGQSSTINVGLQNLFERQPGWGTAGDNKDIFSWFIPDEIIPPGEYRIYSAEDRLPVVWNRYIVAGRGLNQLGGYYLDQIAGSGNNVQVEEGDTISISILNSGDSYVRELLRNSEEESLGVPLTSDRTYNTMAEHQEFFRRNYNEQIHSRVDNINVCGDGRILPSPGEPPKWFGLFEWIEKFTNWNGINGRDDYDGVNGLNNLPSYAMTNPLAATRRRDGYGYGRGGTGRYGYWTSGISWQYRMVGLKENAVESLFEVSGTSAFGGNSWKSNGQTHAVRASIPREPLLSLGQFQHANMNIFDNIPLYSVGHSFSTPWAPVDALFETQGNWTHYDHTWLVNDALWDRFFFSTIAPETNSANLNAAPAEVRPQSQVWDDFLAVGEKHKPLLNQTFVINPVANTKKAKEIIQNKNGYLLSAGYLLQEGTFNINATDERAWRPLLGLNRETPVPANKSPQGVPAALSPLPRAIPLIEGKLDTGGSLTTPSLWRGAKALSDTQIAKLAKALVETIRRRQASSIHKVPYRAPTGQELCRPFFSLAEFVNRALSKESKDREFNYYGVVQAALFKADKDGARINTAASTKTLKRASLDNSTQGQFPHPDAIPEDTIPIATGAPGMLLQGDILQAIGNRISARSDTFVIRAYGDTVSTVNSNKPLAQAYVEAVVQRLPNYVDNTQDADIAPENDHLNRTLNPINRYLGRRFQIVSLRWLLPNEL
jgi:hypothetical protein